MDTKAHLQSLIGDDYTLQWIIGHGGMSTVWLADDTRLNKEVAVKVLRPEFSDNDEFLARFRNEAAAAEGIRSDNVVTTFDYREVPDPAGHTFCFIVMEYVRGESLADLLAREGALAEDLALDVLEQAAHGLSVLHRDGLVHRDIKPGNLMITQNGQVKIADFGIAKAAAAVPLTRTGMVVGTAQYVSPEQAQGKNVGPGSDVYSLGVVGYEMLAGQRPFTGDSGISVALAHVNNAPPALPTTISAETRELIGISLRKDPTTRFADGNELALAVSAVRLGARPPQPASAAMNQVAPEPSPTASTHALGKVAQPTTLRPAADQRQHGVPTPPAPYRRSPAPAPPGGAAAPAQPPPQPQRRRKSGGGFALGLGIALLLAAGIGAAIWAATSGIFDGEGDDITPPITLPPEVVTEYVTPTEQAPEQPTQPRLPELTTQQPDPPATREQPTTQQPDPPTPRGEAPAPAPAPAPQPADPAPVVPEQSAPTQQTPQGPPAEQSAPGTLEQPGNGPGAVPGTGQEASEGAQNMAFGLEWHVNQNSMQEGA